MSNELRPWGFGAPEALREEIAGYRERSDPERLAGLLEALEARIASGGGPDNGGSGGDAAPSGAPVTGGKTGARLAAPRMSLTKPLAWVVGIVGVGAVASLWLQRDGSAVVTDPRTPAGTVVASVVTDPRTPAGTVVASPLPRTEPVPPPVPAPPPTPRSLPIPTATPAEAPASSRKPQARVSRRPPKRPPAPPPKASEDPMAELTLLKRAQKLTVRDPRACLALLAEHRRDFPAGVFAQERELLAIEALLEDSRRTEAEARARIFRRVHPQSAHLRRLRTLLGK